MTEEKKTDDSNAAGEHGSSRSILDLRGRLNDSYLALMNTPGKINDVAFGFAIGVWVSFTPLFGLHTALAFLIATAFRKSTAAAIIGTLVLNPLTGPFIVAAEMELGLFLTGRGDAAWPARISLNLEGLRALYGVGAELIIPFTLGCLALGLVATPACYYLVFRSLVSYRRRLYGKVKSRIESTVKKEVEVLKKAGAKTGEGARKGAQSFKELQKRRKERAIKATKGVTPRTRVTNPASSRGGGDGR